MGGKLGSGFSKTGLQNKYINSLQDSGHKEERRNGAVAGRGSGDKRDFLKMRKIICFYMVDRGKLPFRRQRGDLLECVLEQQRGDGLWLQVESLGPGRAVSEREALSKNYTIF